MPEAETRPAIERFECRDLGPKNWGRELLIAETDSYIGKVLWMENGFGGPLQYHEKKDETFYLLSGTARISYHDEDGALRRVMMYAGESYHVPPGAVHKVDALSDCVFVEASNPVFNDRVRVDE